MMVWMRIHFYSKIAISNYPESLIYYEGSGDTNWKQKVLDLYHSNIKKIIDPLRTMIVGKCALDLKSSEDVSLLLPLLLSYSQDKPSSMSILEKAKGCNVSFNGDVLEAIINTRYVNLEGWKRPCIKYNAPYASSVFDIVEEIKKLQSEEGQENLRQQIKANSKNIKEYFNITYNKYSRNPFISLLLCELGIQMEKRGIFIDAIRFYEWAKNQSDDPFIKRQMDNRWIACKERQGDNDQNDVYLHDSISKRREINLPLDVKIPLIPEIEIMCNWNSIFVSACKIGTDIVEHKEKRKRIENSTNKDSKDLEVLSSNNTITQMEELSKPQISTKSKKLQKLNFAGYDFRFNPSKRELSISYLDDEEDLSIKVRNGELSFDADFVLTETNRIGKEEIHHSHCLLLIK